MLFSGKKLSELQEIDLQNLIANKIQEQDILEYKRDMYGNSDADKREMLKDITAIANHRGGHLIIGIDEDADGIANNLIGIDPGNHVERIVSSCLSNIDKRIPGLEIKDVTLSNGKVALVIRIPQTINSPHMVTFQGINQFWKRHGRQKDRMTIDDIGEAFDKSIADKNKLDRFLLIRKEQTLEKIGDAAYIIISAMPALLGNEIIFDTSDQELRRMITNPGGIVGGAGQSISCGIPYPTIDGLRADQNTPYHNAIDFPQYIELFRNGYIEFGLKFHDFGHGKVFAASDTAYIVNFLAFASTLYDKYLPLTPININFKVYNAKICG